MEKPISRYWKEVILERVSALSAQELTALVKFYAEDKPQPVQPKLVSKLSLELATALQTKPEYVQGILAKIIITVKACQNAQVSPTLALLRIMSL